MTNYEISYEIHHLEDEYAANVNNFTFNARAAEIRKEIAKYRSMCTHEYVQDGIIISAFEIKKDNPNGAKYCCFCGKVKG
jgi:hypothetical protein